MLMQMQEMVDQVAEAAVTEVQVLVQVIKEDMLQQKEVMVELNLLELIIGAAEAELGIVVQAEELLLMEEDQVEKV